ncbi:hypothetical protein EVAR_27463_1 [Eumeta japonica]|uniref:HTH CENPB-type domain-containing protein n=1 Tax=Eumeta variegata TaxID=151549 RepID=A0A4C1VL19_EUMVA|nr:hypothetical protein EVAR_27463_1 [Eumeta japonica]
MVKTYKKKTNRGDWTQESMEKAVDAVIEGKMGYMLAAKTFSVPQTTLEIKVKASRENLAASSSASIKVPLGPKRPIFTEDEEKELCSYIIDMESRLYGLTTKDLKALAYNLAVKNNKPHPFNVQKQEAGKDWVQGFLNRHPELSIRKPESTSAARAASAINNEIDRRPTTPQQSKFSVASPQQILPLPATRKTSRVTRKRGKTAIITASPYKTELEETIKKKKLLEEMDYIWIPMKAGLRVLYVAIGHIAPVLAWMMRTMKQHSPANLAKNSKGFAIPHLARWGYPVLPYLEGKMGTISTSGYLEVTYEYNNKRTSRDKCAKTAARAAHARDGGCGPARTTVRINGRSVKRRSDNRRSTV